MLLWLAAAVYPALQPLSADAAPDRALHLVTTEQDKTDTPVQTPADQPTPSTAPSSDTAPKPASEDAAPAVDPIVAERDHLKEQLLRTAADFDNYRKRARREVEEARMRGKDDAIREVLPVFDNLERAVAAADSAQSVASVVEGVKMVLKLFTDTSERMGLNRVPTVGHRFDPAMHEAIQQKETDEVEAGTIITEVTPGYMFGQRLLRAAMVVVARKPTAKPAEDDPPPASIRPAAASGGVESAAVAGSVRPSQAPQSDFETTSTGTSQAPGDGGADA